ACPFCSSFCPRPHSPPNTTLFPYTTLFRSLRDRLVGSVPERIEASVAGLGAGESAEAVGLRVMLEDAESVRATAEDLDRAAFVRSEEHTSELQSPDHLVCRLLLEKKKQQKD